MSFGFKVNNINDSLISNTSSVNKLTDLLYNALKQTLKDQEFNTYNNILLKKEQEDTNYLRNILGSNLSKQIYSDNLLSYISTQQLQTQKTGNQEEERSLIMNKIIKICFDYPLAKLKKVYSIIKSVININSENIDQINKQHNNDNIRQIDSIKKENEYLNKKHSLSISLLETDNSSNNNHIKSSRNTSCDKKSLLKTVSFINYPTSENKPNTIKQQKSNININYSNEKLDSLINISNFKSVNKIIIPDPTDKSLKTENNKELYKSKNNIFLFDPITIEKYSNSLNNE